jgi:polyribonucleotide nucleotidyltransferase
MTRISIPVDKIGAVIGPGGKVIRGIIEETGATVDVEDDGTVTIGSSDGAAAKRAVEIIEGLTKEAKVGEIYTGKVVRILDFGAFVEILPGTDGMVHISELADHRVPTVEDVVQLGEEITVIVKDIDPSGRIALSRRALLERSGDSESGSDRPEVGSAPRPPDSRPAGPPRGDGRPGGQGGRPGFRQGPRTQGGRGAPRGGDRPGPGPGGRRQPR